MGETSKKLEDELVGILLGPEGRTLLGTKGSESLNKAEELTQWLYEHFQANGLESVTVNHKAYHSQKDQYWVEALLEYGHQVYSVSTLTESEQPDWRWQLQIRNKWATHVEGSWTDKQIEDAQLELNSCITIETITKKLVEIRKRYDKEQEHSH